MDEINGHRIIGSFKENILIVRCEKDEGLGYKEFRMYDILHNCFLTYNTRNKSVIYSKSIAGIKKEYELTQWNRMESDL